MASSFPGTLDSFATNRTDATAMATNQAADHNNYADAINKIERTFGPDVYSVLNYGATGNGSTDDTAAIQAAIDAVPADGGTVYFPVGIYKITAGLVIDRSFITLQGAGIPFDFYSSTTDQYSTIIWFGTNGGGPMLSIEPPGTDSALTGVAVDNLHFSGSSHTGLITGAGMLIRDVNGGRFTNLEIRSCIDYVLKITTAAGSGVRGSSDCYFENVYCRTDSFTGPDGDCFWLDSDGGTGNVYHCTFVRCAAQYHNGTAWKLGNCDTNWFLGCAARCGGTTGIGIEFGGSDTSGFYARYNTFFGWSNDISASPNSVIARGTGLDFPSINNIIYSHTRGNGNPVPTIETGATLWYLTDTGSGLWNDLSLNTSLAVGTNPSTTGVVRLPNNEYIYARNAANSANVSLMRINNLDEVGIDTRVRFGQDIIVADTRNLQFSATTGTKFGTGATQKIGFWNATPVAQDTGWAVTGQSSVKSINKATVTIDDLTDFVMTMAATLKTYGLLGA